MKGLAGFIATLLKVWEECLLDGSIACLTSHIPLLK